MTEPTAVELRDALRRGDMSSVELTRQSLDRAAAHSHLGAFVEVRAEIALEAAAAADRLFAAAPADERHRLPPLLGLPTAHKDLVQVEGFATTYGSRAVPHRIARADDPIVASVRRAGAVCIGKTQVPEFGIAGYSENLVADAARNPFDQALTAGGSSGGTAVAIASNTIAAAIGSDAGGSIRIPSAACGLIGLKTGRNTIPADAAGGDTDELGVPRMAVSGPMARNARDAALFFDAISIARGSSEPLGAKPVFEARRSLQTHGRHAAASEPALLAVERAADFTGARIGVSFTSPFEPHLAMRFDDDARATVARASALLEAAGHAVEPASIDYGDEYLEAFTTVWTQALRRIDLPPGGEAQLGELATWFLDSARAASPEHVSACVDALKRFSRRTAAQWAAYDFVLTPALAFSPPAIGGFWARGPEGDYRLQCEWAPQTSVVNVVGVPAITAPAGFDAAGLPRGVQLIGRIDSEIQLLQLAEQLAT